MSDPLSEPGLLDVKNLSVTFGTGAGQISTIPELVTALASYPAGMGTATVDTNGNLTFTASGTNTVTVSPSATAAKFGISVFTAYPASGAVLGQDTDAFLKESLGGGAITTFDISGSPVNIQLRWAKLSSALYGGTDTWNLFYQTNSNATGTQVAWQNVNTNFTFSASGQMSPAVPSVTLANAVVNGVALGSPVINFGTGGVTQFADANGNVKVNQIQQDGFPAGSLQTVSIGQNGRVVGNYSNGRNIDLAQISVATFNGTNFLKRIDGGAFEATDQSGQALFGSGGTIVGSSLENSNTDIADEFTKLIVTQQAYSANTKVITTSNSMVQDLLNVLR